MMNAEIVNWTVAVVSLCSLGGSVPAYGGDNGAFGISVQRISDRNGGPCGDIAVSAPFSGRVYVFSSKTGECVNVIECPDGSTMWGISLFPAESGDNEPVGNIGVIYWLPEGKDGESGGSRGLEWWASAVGCSDRRLHWSKSMGVFDDVIKPISLYTMDSAGVSSGVGILSAGGNGRHLSELDLRSGDWNSICRIPDSLQSRRIISGVSDDAGLSQIFVVHDGGKNADSLEYWDLRDGEQATRISTLSLKHQAYGGRVVCGGMEEIDGRLTMLIGRSHGPVALGEGVTPVYYWDVQRALLSPVQLPIKARTMANDARALDLGHSVRWVPDVDGDGVKEIALGGPEMNIGFDGKVFIIGSKRGELLHTLGTELDVEHFGQSIDLIGDLTGDGISEVCVGAVSYRNPGVSGALFVFDGASYQLVHTLVPPE